jgi:hypothetical protein
VAFANDASDSRLLGPTAPGIMRSLVWYLSVVTYGLRSAKQNAAEDEF